MTISILERTLVRPPPEPFWVVGDEVTRFDTVVGTMTLATIVLT
jgi:hypothetical protein